MRTILIVAALAASPAVQAQEQGRPPSEEDLIRRDGALIYGPGYDEAYRAGLAEGYEVGFDDGRHEEAERRAEDRPRDTEGVTKTVTTAGHGDGRTRFTEVRRGYGVEAPRRAVRRRGRR